MTTSNLLKLGIITPPRNISTPAQHIRKHSFSILHNTFIDAGSPPAAHIGTPISFSLSTDRAENI